MDPHHHEEEMEMTPLPHLHQVMMGNLLAVRDPQEDRDPPGEEEVKVVVEEVAGAPEDKLDHHEEEEEEEEAEEVAVSKLIVIQ